MSKSKAKQKKKNSKASKQIKSKHEQQKQISNELNNHYHISNSEKMNNLDLENQNSIQMCDEKCAKQNRFTKKLASFYELDFVELKPSWHTINMRRSKTISSMRFSQNTKIRTKDLYCMKFVHLIQVINYFLVHGLEDLHSSCAFLNWFFTSHTFEHCFLLFELRSIPLVLHIADYIALEESCTHNKNARRRQMAKRPSYLIERDQHIFGGCVDEDAGDEFFMTSGAIYQSWPYVYEPGFRVQPLVATIVQRFKSNSCSNLDDEKCMLRCESQELENGPRLHAYSLDDYDFDINLINTRCSSEINARKCNKNKKISKSSSSRLSSCCILYKSMSSEQLSSLNNHSKRSDYDEHDDSDSYTEYKKRHAKGLLPLVSYTYSLNSSSSIKSTIKSKLRSVKSYCFESYDERCEVDKRRFLNFSSQKKVDGDYFNPNDYYILMQHQNPNRWATFLNSDNLVF